MTRGSVSRELRTDDQATSKLLYNLIGSRVPQAPLPGEHEEGPKTEYTRRDSNRRSSKDVLASEAAWKAQREREKEAFVDSICDTSTRYDVAHWIGRLYTMFGEEMTAAAEEKENAKRIRGISGMSALSSESESSFEGTHQDLGALSIRAHAEVGDENDQATWTDAERLQHYLDGRDPEQQAFVNQMITKRVRNLQREVDAELTKGRRAQLNAKGIWKDERNDLRLKNTRRFMLKQGLEANMGHWLWETLGAWKDGAKQRSLERAQNAEPTDVDIVFRTLTKPSTNIDPTRMVSEIPQFKTLYTSYSLPASWRDRYLK